MYTFPIPNTKRHIYQVLAYGILLLNIAGMSVVISASENQVAQILIQLIIFISMIAWEVNAYKKHQRLLPIGIFLLAYSIFWLRTGINWAFAANLLLWTLYTISKRKMFITIAEQYVTYPSFPKKTIDWEELNNVILKDDVLTIDCKNNKIYQHFIHNADEFAEQVKFNEFCIKQLEK